MTSTDANFQRIAMPVPFAGGDGAARTAIRTDNEGENANEVNYFDGFPAIYSADLSEGGKYVTREEMNAVGYMATASSFYGMAGGLNTFDQQFASMIGGYPKGAVLDYSSESGVVRKIISTKDDNTSNPYNTIGTDWNFLSQVSNTTNDIFHYENCNKIDFTNPVSPKILGALSNNVIAPNSTLILGYPYNAIWIYAGEFTANSDGVLNLSIYADLDITVFEAAKAFVSAYNYSLIGYGVSACIVKSGDSMSTASSYLAISSVGTCTFAKATTSGSTTTYSAYPSSFSATKGSKYSVFFNISPAVIVYAEELTSTNTRTINTYPVAGYVSNMLISVS